MSIPPKPTTVFGITFRSRLEAQWAVFWNRLNEITGGVVTKVTYEDFTGPDGKTLSNYPNPPDFRIQCFNGTLMFQEVKPLYPSEEYRDLLRGLANDAWPHSLFLSVGGFRDASWPVIYPYPYGGWKLTLSGFLNPMLGMYECESLFEYVRNYRFDLTK